MKKMLMMLVVLVVGTQSLLAAVIQSSNIVLTEDDIYRADYMLTIYQNEEATDYTSLGFIVSGSTLSHGGHTLDEGSDWYSVGLGDEFSVANIANGDFLALHQSWPAEHNDLNVSGYFYLGVATSQGTSERDIFGWVRLQNIGGVVSMVDNAVSYAGTGIIVGTTQAVPEPASVVMISLGGVVIVGFRKVRKSYGL